MEVVKREEGDGALMQRASEGTYSLSQQHEVLSRA